MNAFHSTVRVLQLQMANLMAIAIQSGAALQTAYTELLCDCIGPERISYADKAERFRVIEDNEQEVHAAGEAATVLAEALRELGGYGPVSNQYEMIRRVRLSAHRAASKAESILANNGVISDTLFG